MALMIDAEPLAAMLADVDTANAGRERIMSKYHALERPTTEQTEQFFKQYQEASVTWANACGALAFAVGVAVDLAKANSQ